jgi:hypothetical protein
MSFNVLSQHGLYPTNKFIPYELQELIASIYIQAVYRLKFNETMIELKKELHIMHPIDCPALEAKTKGQKILDYYNKINSETLYYMIAHFMNAVRRHSTIRQPTHLVLENERSYIAHTLSTLSYQDLIAMRYFIEVVVYEQEEGDAHLFTNSRQPGDRGRRKFLHLDGYIF